MQKINLKVLKNLLPHYYKEKKSLYLWGKPSSGKTSMLRQFAQAKALELKLEYSEDKYGPKIFTFKVITMSQYDAPDLRGMPQIDTAGAIKVTRFLPTEELPREGQGLIFFDEMNLADDTVRAAMYQYILEGRLSNLPRVLGEKGEEVFWRVAASNSEQDFCSVNVSSLALLSRFCHLEIEPEVDESINYLLEHEDDARIIGYLKNFPEDLFPKKWDESLLDKKANPFPRQWENASHLIKGMKEYGQIHDLVGSCVGPEVATRFVAWAKMADKLNIPAFIAKPKEEIAKVLKSDQKASLFYAVISSLASYWFKKNKALVPKKVVEIATNLPPEFSVAFLKMILKKRTNELVALAEFDKLLNKLGIYFDEV